MHKQDLFWIIPVLVFVAGILTFLGCTIFADHKVQGYYIASDHDGNRAEPLIFCDIDWCLDSAIIPRENMTMQQKLEWCIEANKALGLK